MIIENINESAFKPGSGDIILSCLRHSSPLMLICYNLIMPSALTFQLCTNKREL